MRLSTIALDIFSKTETYNRYLEVEIVILEANLVLGKEKTVSEKLKFIKNNKLSLSMFSKRKIDHLEKTSLTKLRSANA